MITIISIIGCCILSFLYIILYRVLMRLKVSTFIKRYYNYIWAVSILIIALIYPNSLLRNESFEFLYNGKIVMEILKIAVFACIIGCFSGYKTINRKHDFNFCIIFPIFEEILFRGVIFLILINIAGLSNKYAVVLSALFFGIMHFQYFGLKKDVIRYVLFAFIGGCFFANIVLMTKSILPSIFLHMAFNTSAIVFSKYSSKKVISNK
ncbi:CPBP family intramembrane glutamic endopeptidase [Candidatus Clostridium stratigraminis]|uniref:CPBP family intramembrane glutamic endopeptidase n=1 Tax=Candidatus Clostridium stratigraminis TaxID=3381661 RepID=A0ABW8T834_9CLOT